MKKTLAAILPGALLLALPACMHHSVETTSEVKPIHIVLDVNVKVDRALDNYFAPQQEGAAAIPEAVSLEDALKPVDAANPPPKETMMGRFIARKAELRKLKTGGIAGEDAAGYLQFVTDKQESKNLVDAENADRAIVYERIAKAQNSTPAKVAKQKAEKNAVEAKPGDYVKDSSGVWGKKQ